ncbi:MAG: translation initiation factor IF-1 [Erysipelotrichaceae bacterium]|nr:translation initiation factor IF-1 [Erysipelotrichaceae bacterium]
MSKDLVKVDGVIVDIHPSRQFEVKLDNGIVVRAYASGKIVTGNIRLLMNDRVVVELSPYDLTKGRIVYRKKDSHVHTRS